ncbi:unnamed protein product, partial [Scytosiphon promiscuus]
MRNGARLPTTARTSKQKAEATAFAAINTSFTTCVFSVCAQEHHACSGSVGSPAAFTCFSSRALLFFFFCTSQPNSGVCCRTSVVPGRKHDLSSCCSRTVELRTATLDFRSSR